MVADPAVEATVRGRGLPLGHEIPVRLVAADFDRGSVAFEMAG
jgi:hypothetical protein